MALNLHKYLLSISKATTYVSTLWNIFQSSCQLLMLYRVVDWHDSTSNHQTQQPLLRFLLFSFVTIAWSDSNLCICRSCKNICVYYMLYHRMLYTVYISLFLLQTPGHPNIYPGVPQRSPRTFPHVHYHHRHGNVILLIRHAACHLNPTNSLPSCREWHAAFSIKEPDWSKWIGCVHDACAFPLRHVVENCLLTDLEVSNGFCHCFLREMKAGNIYFKLAVL